MKKALLSIICLVSLTACSSTGGLNVKVTATTAKIAAKDATYFALKSHPEWRVDFETAFTEISVLAAANQVDVAALSAIVQRLPIKQLKGTTAAIIITDTQIILEQIVPNDGTIVSADPYTDPRIVINAIKEGMRLGLDMP